MIHLIYFSPTHTTRKTLKAIARGTEQETGQTIDLTLPEQNGTPTFSAEDLVLIGMPVYGGRIPAIAEKRLKEIQGGGASVVPVVVYGNRHYDDALIELFDLCRDQGFRPVAAGAFLGEHSFSTEALRLSEGRPDADDLTKAENFGRQIGIAELKEVPGNRPYKDQMNPAGSATGVDSALCTRCGQCVEICPTGGMQLTETAAEADPDNCIWCMACERFCPAHARSITHEMVQGAIQKLNEFFSERREPEIFIG